MHVTCLVKRWEHHTASGGYDRLATEVGANIVSRRKINGLVGQIARKLWRDRTGTGAYLFDYQFGDLLAEMSILASGLVRPPDVLHVLYGDEQLDQILRWRGALRCPLVVTFHQPSHRVEHRYEAFQKGLAKGIDAAVVVSSSQVEGFEKWIGTNKVVYIPHGIDSASFCPAERSPDRPRLQLLIVGEHLRDWMVTHKVIDEINYLRIPVDFHVVTKPELFAYFNGCVNTYFYSGISELELIRLYREADALLVPLVEATANNAILEASACGTPVISTRVGGIPDYVDGTSGWLFPKGEVSPIIELVKCLSADRSFAESLRKGARTKALGFDWHRVAKRMAVLYSAVENGRPPQEAMRNFEQS
jgi:glycosyltransferase involved in cell wall biosynthesis